MSGWVGWRGSWAANCGGEQKQEVGAAGATGSTGSTGATGSAIASLMSTVAEPAASNCTTGGNKITSGPDSNANSVLDASEVAATSYVCNGATGAQGASLNWVDVTEGNRGWGALASSNDGNQLVAVDDNPGQIYISSDSGVTWTARESDRFWYGVASSADGSKLVACEEPTASTCSAMRARCRCGSGQARTCLTSTAPDGRQACVIAGSDPHNPGGAHGHRASPAAAPEISPTGRPTCRERDRDRDPGLRTRPARCRASR